MRRTQFLLLAVAAGAALTSCVAVRQTAAAAELPAFRGTTAVIFDDARAGAFKADRAFALAAAGNEQGKVFALDHQMVRITPPERAGLWIHCSDLQAGLSYCDASGAVAALEIPRSLPLCPGDPRCPKRNPRNK